MGVPETEHADPASIFNIALSLIGCPEVSITLASVLCDALISADADTAKPPAFSLQADGVRCILLDETVYDPSGTLDRCRVLKRELEMKEHNMQLLEDQVLGSSDDRVHPLPFFIVFKGTAVDVNLVVGSKSRQGSKHSNKPLRN